jgi:hypothetical protein
MLREAMRGTPGLTSQFSNIFFFYDYKKATGHKIMNPKYTCTRLYATIVSYLGALPITIFTTTEHLQTGVSS